MTPFLQQLTQKLGADCVLTQSADLAPALTEWRGLYQGEAIALVMPRSTADVVSVVQLCAEYNVPITPQSGRTGLVGGGVPQGGIVLSLKSLNAIRSVDAANFTLIAEAGCLLQHVQEAADQAGLLFPLSLASEGSCCIGGNLATNAGGSQVLRYGTMRDLTLGLEVVLADGAVWHGLKGLRKDNMGYDLKSLMIGSEGTLGIITAAVLKLFPKPKTSATACVACATPHDALNLFQLLRDEMGDALSAFEYWPLFGMELVLKHKAAQDPFAQPHPFYALMELTSPDPQALLKERLTAFLDTALEQGLIKDAVIASSERQAAALWALREHLSEAQSLEGASIKHDVAVPVSQVADFIVETTQLCEAALHGIRVCAFGHMGDGNVHFNLSQPPHMQRADFLAEWARFNRIVHDQVMKRQGSIAAEHGIGLLKREELMRYEDPAKMTMMLAIKKAFDPQNLLNPGKIFVKS
jgi:FAD/FMN-containing dehydrogenase